MNRTLVISIDALISADIERLKKLPNLGRIMKQASWAEDILCCYTDLSLPCNHFHRLLAGPPRYLQQ